MAVNDLELSKFPWLAMAPKQGADMYGDQFATPTTQQDLNKMSGQQNPYASVIPGFTPYYNTPEGQAELQLFEENRQKALQQQQEGISQYEELLNSHLAKTQNDPKIDLSPLMSFADNLYGTRLTQNYKGPQSSKAALETTADLQQGLQKAKGSLANTEQQYGLAKIGLRQKADEAYLKAIENMRGLSSLEKRSEDKIKAAALQGGGVNLTPGQKALDVSFAKDLDEWSSGGEATVDKNLNRLREARDKLASASDDSNISGRFVGRLPNVLRPEDSIVVQQDVQAAALGALKATLGAQFTEKEGQRIMSIAYDPTLTPTENVKKIDAAIAELEASKQNKNAKAAEFMQAGTLKEMSKQKPAASPTQNPLTREEKIKLLKAKRGGG